MRKRMRRLLKHTPIKIKVVVLYCTVLVLSLFFVLIFFGKINERNMEHEVGEVGMQTISALKGNIDFILDNVNQFSDLIYCDKDVQDILSHVDSASINPNVSKVIQKSLVNMLLSGDYIDSVYIFDEYWNAYYSYKNGPVIINKNKIESSNWYKELQEARGNTFFIAQSEGVLNFPTRPNKNYITLIREITDLDDYTTHLATLLITIDEAIFQSYFEEVSKAYNSQFCIVDGSGQYIIEPKAYREALETYFHAGDAGETDYTTLKIDNDKMIFVQKELGIKDWRLVGVLKLGNGGMSEVYKSVVKLIVCLNLIFVFLSMLFSTKLIFMPLKRIQKHMALVEAGDFIPIEDEEDRRDEISDLRKGFNKMVTSIQELIEKVKEEEKIIAKNELSIIQAQINPHFLYNTLDAVSALALIEDHENCFKMTQALGNFYRNSLNSGLDFVTVNDEIECIQSYLTILNIRYGGKLAFQYDIEEEIKNSKMLKLILQPVVENAVHHGIKSNKGVGLISIKGYRDEDELCFIVADDGVGMSETCIREILSGTRRNDKSGFGLHSLIQRISLYYDIQNPITIISEIGSGTEVAIRLKVLEGEAK